MRWVCSLEISLPPSLFICCAVMEALALEISPCRLLRLIVFALNWYLPKRLPAWLSIRPPCASSCKRWFDQSTPWLFWIDGVWRDNTPSVAMWPRLLFNPALKFNVSVSRPRWIQLPCWLFSCALFTTKFCALRFAACVSICCGDVKPVCPSLYKVAWFNTNGDWLERRSMPYALTWLCAKSTETASTRNCPPAKCLAREVTVSLALNVIFAPCACCISNLRVLPSVFTPAAINASFSMWMFWAWYIILPFAMLSPRWEIFSFAW